MKVFRYNSKKRSDRKFNRTDIEKNPNKIKFYAKSLKYANNYKYIYLDDGDIDTTCELEIKNISIAKLFDMDRNYSQLKTYQNYINSQIENQKRDYLFFLNKATTNKEKKNWNYQIENLKNREKELIQSLKNTEFQALSDYDIQNALVKELKSLGFLGYKTKNEIAIF